MTLFKSYLSSTLILILCSIFWLNGFAQDLSKADASQVEPELYMTLPLEPLAVYTGKNLGLKFLDDQPTLGYVKTTILPGKNSKGYPNIKDELILLDLESKTVFASVPVSGQSFKYDFSPDKSRLIICYLHGDLFVYDFKAKKMFNLSTKAPQYCRKLMRWLEPGKIHFCDPSSNPSFQKMCYLDLDQLTFHWLDSDTPAGQKEIARKLEQFDTFNMPALNPQYYFVVPDRTKKLYICNRQNSYNRILFKNQSFGDDFAFSRDAKYICVAQEKKPLLIYKMKAKADPPTLVFRIQLLKDEWFTPKQKEIFEKTWQRGAQIFANVNGAKVNPLNEKVVGGDGKYKGSVEIVKSNETVSEVQIAYHHSEIKVGDVVTGFFADRGVKIEGIWAVLQPVDALDATFSSSETRGDSDVAGANESVMDELSEADTWPDPDAEIIVDEEPEPLNRRDVLIKIGYPDAAKDRGIQGTVLLKILINKEGKYVKHILVENVHPILSEPVEKYAPELRFTPAKKDGKAIAYWVEMPFKFKLLE